MRGGATPSVGRETRPPGAETPEAFSGLPCCRGRRCEQGCPEPTDLPAGGEDHWVVAEDDVRLVHQQVVTVVVGVPTPRSRRVVEQATGLRRLARQDRRAVVVEADSRRCPVARGHEHRRCHRVVGGVHARIARVLPVDRVAELDAIGLRRGDRLRRVADLGRGAVVAALTVDAGVHLVVDLVGPVRLMRVAREVEAVRLVAVREVGVLANDEAAVVVLGVAVRRRVAVTDERQTSRVEAVDDDHAVLARVVLSHRERQRRAVARRDGAGREVGRVAVVDETRPSRCRCRTRCEAGNAGNRCDEQEHHRELGGSLEQEIPLPCS